MSERKALERSLKIREQVLRALHPNLSDSQIKKRAKEAQKRTLKRKQKGMSRGGGGAGLKLEDLMGKPGELSKKIKR